MAVTTELQMGSYKRVSSEKNVCGIEKLIFLSYSFQGFFLAFPYHIDMLFLLHKKHKTFADK